MPFNGLFIIELCSLHMLAYVPYHIWLANISFHSVVQFFTFLEVQRWFDEVQFIIFLFVLVLFEIQYWDTEMLGKNTLGLKYIKKKKDVFWSVFAYKHPDYAKCLKGEVGTWSQQLQVKDRFWNFGIRNRLGKVTFYMHLFWKVKWISKIFLSIWRRDPLWSQRGKRANTKITYSSLKWCRILLIFFLFSLLSLRICF